MDIFIGSSLDMAELVKLASSSAFLAFAAAAANGDPGWACTKFIKFVALFVGVGAFSDGGGPIKESVSKNQK